MTTNLLLLLIAAIGIVALVTLILYIRAKDPFQAALASLLSALTVLVGSLGVPEFRGQLQIDLNLGFVAVRSIALQVLVGTPPLLWITAFISIVVLIVIFAVILRFENRDRRAHQIT